MFGRFFKRAEHTENMDKIEKFSANVIPEEDSYISVLLRSGEILEGANYSNGMIFESNIPTTRKFLFEEEYVKEWYYTKML